MEQLRLPVGIEDFAEIRRHGYYYVDKTQLIEQVLNRRNKVSLFTRPRRFGKTLNMSMLQHFFEIGTDPKFFQGLSISKNNELCEKHMGKYPVVSISLKSIHADSYAKAKAQLIKLVNREARRVQFLLNSDRLTAVDKALFSELLDREMEEDTLVSSLQELTELLEIHFGQQVIVLIDEYDVPLAKANQNGYYDEMALLLRNFFENVLKTNDSLEFAVLTGCLRIAKESIFTGLNNFKVYSITDTDYDETFGFVDDEVKKMLKSLNQQDHYEEVKEWYDGYRFGNTDVYCPWDVVNYCADHLTTPNATPKNYWLNTSGNEVINHFIDSVGEPQKLAKTELERLVSGNVVRKRINETITYKELYSTIDNLWSTLFMTGYLTQRGSEDDGRYRLVIPNREIRNIVTDNILSLFQDEVKKDGQMANAFCQALMEGKEKEVERLLTAYMGKTISIRDTFVRKSIKENFYHGILLGILSFKTGWEVSSNRESGTGFSDILIEIDDSDIGIVIEVKYSDDEDQLEKDCKEALKQIKDRDYTQKLRDAGFHKILKYGIACQIKTCKVLVEI
ncbi:MAG: AAA family ATPase [Lachnospiraceae bacterium]